MSDLITIDEYKAFASIEGKKTDPQITSLITSCSKLVQDYIGYTVPVDGTSEQILRAVEGSQTYMLESANADISSIFYEPKGSTSKVELKADLDYYVSDTGRLEIFDLIPHRGDRFQITSNTKSEDLEAIKLATMLLVRYYFKEEYNKSAMGAGGQTVTYQTGKNFPPQVRAILMMYRMF